MKRKSTVLCLICFAALFLGSCSGLPTGGGFSTGGTSTLAITLQDTPPANISILSFSVTISGVTLTPPTGTPVNLTLSPAQQTFELSHLQSDSQLLGSFPSVPAGTYNNVSVAISSMNLVFLNNTGSSITVGSVTCPNNTICSPHPAGTTVTISSAPFPLTLTNGGTTGIAIDFNLDAAITSTLGVNFTATGAVSASALPHTGTPSGSLDLIENFTGTITAVSSSSLTVQSGTRGTLTGTLGSSTLYYDPLPICITVGAGCLAVNQVVSVNAGVNTDGTVSILAVDFIDQPLSGANEIEGTVAQIINSTSFLMTLSDKVNATSDIALTAANIGTPITVTLSATPVFYVDTWGMSVSNSSLFTGGSTTSAIFPGQTIMAQVGALSGTTSLSATAGRVLLRPMTATATVATSSATSFTINASALPPYFQVAFATATPLVQVTTGVTNYDYVASAGSLAASDVVSIRALYLQNGTGTANPAFFAAKVRKH